VTVAAFAAEGEHGVIGQVVVIPGDVPSDVEGQGIGAGEARREFGAGERFSLGRRELGKGGTAICRVGAVEGCEEAPAAFEGGRGQCCGIEAGSEELFEAVAEGGDGREAAGEGPGDDGLRHAGILDHWPKLCPAG